MKRFRQAICVMMTMLVLPGEAALAVEKGYTVFHGDRNQPRVALTVDDCYNGENVAEMIALCEVYQVPITFFVIGSALKHDDAALWQSALNAGCEIGNHTWSHAVLPT